MGPTTAYPSKHGLAETPALRAQSLRCVLCGSGLAVVLDLGEQPLANGLLEQPDDPCARYPLQLAECSGCRHVQLAAGVPPEAMFSHYVYRTGASQTMVRHFAELSFALANRLPGGARVFDVGSNDGTLLKQLRNGRGLSAWGVDPSDIAAEVPWTIRRFFTAQVARELVQGYGAADCVVIANCLAHVPDPAGMVAGAAHLLRHGGLLVLEVPYVRDLVEQLAYPTIYHEHLSYWSAARLNALLVPVGFAVERVERLSVHHGSLRVWARRVADPQRAPVDSQWLALLQSETAPIDWAEFAERVRTHRGQLREACAGAERLVGYACPAKATVLLNYCDLHLDLISDTTPEKQGGYLPGLGTPIVPPSDLRDYAPDRVLLLAPNFTSEILAQEPGLAGRWIIPFPAITRA